MNLVININIFLYQHIRTGKNAQWCRVILRSDVSGPPGRDIEPGKVGVSKSLSQREQYKR